MVKTRKGEAPALCGCCHSVESAFGEFLMRHLGQMLPTELMPLAEETIGKRCSAKAFSLIGMRSHHQIGICQPFFKWQGHWGRAFKMPRLLLRGLGCRLAAFLGLILFLRVSFGQLCFELFDFLLQLSVLCTGLCHRLLQLVRSSCFLCQLLFSGI